MNKLPASFIDHRAKFLKEYFTLKSEKQFIANDYTQKLYVECAENPTHDKVTKFLNECSKSIIDTEVYYESILRLMGLPNIKDNKGITRIFETAILPKVYIPYKEYYFFYNISDDLYSIIEEYDQNNEFADKIIAITDIINKNGIYENYTKNPYIFGVVTDITESMIESGSIDSFYSNNRIDMAMALFTTIYETSYLYEKYGQLDKIAGKNMETAAEAIVYNYKLRGFDAGDMWTASNLIHYNSIFHESNTRDEYINTGKKYCDEFMNGTIDRINLSILKSRIINLSAGEILQGFTSFLNTLYMLICASKFNDDISEFIIEEMIPELYNSIIDCVENKKDQLNIVNNIITALKGHINDMDAMIMVADSNPNINKDHIYSVIRYKKNLSILVDRLSDSKEFLYTEYAFECANTSYVSENVEVISVNEFKLFKFDNIITRCFKADKAIQRGLINLGKKVAHSVKSIGEKIFGENTNVYEMFTEDGTVDYLVTSCELYEDTDIEKLQPNFTDIIKEVNTNILAGSSLVAYYMVNPDRVEFCVRESANYIIGFTEEDLNEMSKVITIENKDRLALIESANNFIIEDNSDYYIKEAIKAFCNSNNPYYFDTFIDACSIIGITEETMKDKIIDPLVENFGMSFRTKYIYEMENYKPVQKADIESILEAMTAMSIVIEANKNNGNLDTKKQEELRGKIANKVNNVKDTNQSKVSNAVNKVKDTAQSKISNTINKAAEKKQANTDKMVKYMNNLKLYMNGLRGKINKVDNKTKTMIRNMDDAGERFTNNLKKALVSDRREAIIKGSVIPSFHKCIMLAASFCGLWAFNPPLAIVAAVGGFAVSKNLTKKERALMYDDIMIELRIIDKEIERAEAKNQTKKLRQLLRLKKEMERQATRIHYNIRLGKDVIPGGHYANRDED